MVVKAPCLHNGNILSLLNMANPCPSQNKQMNHDCFHNMYTRQIQDEKRLNGKAFKYRCFFIVQLATTEGNPSFVFLATTSNLTFPYLDSLKPGV